MNTSSLVTLSAPDDTALVRACLAGDARAFRPIVDRYRSLLCSLAYSATGNLAQSEDLAQEAFVTAWKNLAELREPAKLRPWLCGIVRNLIHRSRRVAGRDPAQPAAEPDSAADSPAPGPSPQEAAVTREEAAILWRTLAGLPETYRAPLVLFYRGHHSVADIAAALDLSEDAVKQRLSRGRALLESRVQALVEGTLARTAPTSAFTSAVMAMLPLAGGGLPVAAGVAAPSAAGTKSAGWLPPLAALGGTQVLWLISSFAAVGALGAVVGWQMGSRHRSAAEHHLVVWFWRIFAAGLLLCVVPILIRTDPVSGPPFTATLLAGWLGAFEITLLAAVIGWAVANHRRLRRPTGAPPVPVSSLPRDTGLLAAGVVVFLALGFGYGMSRSHWYEKLGPAEVWPAVAARPGAELRLRTSDTGSRWLEIIDRRPDGTVRLHGPLTDADRQRLRASGRPVRELVAGRDYEVLGWPGRRLPLVTLLGLGTGLAFLLRAGLDRRQFPRPGVDEPRPAAA
jgi:RNA polymerase sigma factor (sigma-70 family)